MIIIIVIIMVIIIIIIIIIIVIIIVIVIIVFQIPRYIITLHELLAHTPHEHVERRSLEFAKSKLEELSRVGNVFITVK